MKTKKVKGFTLIELIVVIAIIGVLAAILVPAMLGYVKKSKIQSANSAASTILKACNSALTELDELDCTFGSGSGTISHAAGAAIGSANSASIAAGGAVGATEVLDYMTPYFDGARSTEFSIDILNNVAVACAAKSGAYVGTAPSVYSNKNYPSSTPSIANALSSARSKYDAKH